MDQSRKRILELIEYKTWGDFLNACNKDEAKMVNIIVNGLRNPDLKVVVVHPPSKETLEFLCSYNNIRRLADNIAHDASPIEIQQAILMNKNSEDGLPLQELYNFVFPNPI